MYFRYEPVKKVSKFENSPVVLRILILYVLGVQLLPVDYREESYFVISLPQVRL